LHVGDIPALKSRSFTIHCSLAHLSTIYRPPCVHPSLIYIPSSARTHNLIPLLVTSVNLLYHPTVGKYLVIIRLKGLMVVTTLLLDLRLTHVPCLLECARFVRENWRRNNHVSVEFLGKQVADKLVSRRVSNAHGDL